MEMKTCTKCKQEYPKTTEYFYIGRKHYFRAECKKCTYIITKKWTKNNPEKVRASKDLWVKNNPEKSRTAIASWAKNNLDSRARTAARRRSRKRNNISEPYTEQQVLDKYGHNCYLCQEPIDFTVSRKDPKGFQVEHFIPISKGGPDTLENVRPSHAACNWSKGNKIIQSQVL